MTCSIWDRRFTVYTPWSFRNPFFSVDIRTCKSSRTFWNLPGSSAPKPEHFQRCYLGTFLRAPTNRPFASYLEAFWSYTATPPMLDLHRSPKHQRLRGGNFCRWHRVCLYHLYLCFHNAPRPTGELAARTSCYSPDKRNEKHQVLKGLFTLYISYIHASLLDWRMQISASPPPRQTSANLPNNSTQTGPFSGRRANSDWRMNRWLGVSAPSVVDFDAKISNPMCEREREYLLGKRWGWSEGWMTQTVWSGGELPRSFSKSKAFSTFDHSLCTIPTHTDGPAKIKDQAKQRLHWPASKRNSCVPSTGTSRTSQKKHTMNSSPPRSCFSFAASRPPLDELVGIP